MRPPQRLRGVCSTMEESRALPLISVTIEKI